MSVDIIVVEAFTEVRTGRTYQPGEKISDPHWHQPGDRKAEAYAARGVVRLEPVAETSPAAAAPVTLDLADGVSDLEAHASGQALAARRRTKGDK